MTNHYPFSCIDVGEGFPVLLGHSYLFSKDMWHDQIAALSKHFRVIAPDLWGHGDSPALPPECQSNADLAKEFLAFMQQQKINEFAIIGLSVGGMWGAELASMAPDNVKALVLMDTWLGAETEVMRQQYDVMLNAVEKAGAIVSPLLEHIVSQFYSESASPSLPEKLSQHLRSLSANTLRESIVPIGRIIFRRPDRLAILKSITCPCLVITGEKDLPRPPSEGQAMADILQCEHLIIPKAGHISNQHSPEHVSTILLDFLQRTL